MPVTNYVPDYLVYRYCDVCYRMAELQVHSKSAFQTVRRGRVPCRHRYRDVPCNGRLAIKPRDMRRMMVEERNRQPQLGRGPIAEMLEWDDEPYSVVDAAEIAHRERLEAERIRELPQSAYWTTQYLNTPPDSVGYQRRVSPAEITTAMESLMPNRRHRRSALAGEQSPERVNMIRRRPFNDEDNPF